MATSHSIRWSVLDHERLIQPHLHEVELVLFTTTHLHSFLYFIQEASNFPAREAINLYQYNSTLQPREAYRSLHRWYPTLDSMCKGSHP
jgi:hypothetical protein